MGRKWQWHRMEDILIYIPSTWNEKEEKSERVCIVENAVADLSFHGFEVSAEKNSSRLIALRNISHNSRNEK